MSLQTEIQRITTIRNNIRTKLINLGIISNTSAKLQDCYNGLNNVKKQGAKTVNPTESAQTAVSAGAYVSGNVNVGAISKTYVGSGVTKKAAATYTPTTTNQTISAGQYLSGAQTISGDADLVASKIKYGVNIFNVEGNVRQFASASKNVTSSTGHSWKCRQYLSTAVKTVTIAWFDFNPGFTPIYCYTSDKGASSTIQFPNFICGPGYIYSDTSKALTVFTEVKSFSASRIVQPYESNSVATVTNSYGGYY